MAVPAARADRSTIGRDSSGTHAGSETGWISRKTAPDQVWNRRLTGRWRTVGRWLDIGGAYAGIINNFLLKIVDDNVERAAGEKIGTGVVKARLGQLPVRRSAREIRNGQDGNKDDKGENNDERSAFGGAITRMKELFHGVRRVYGDR